jgi:hypothetical protein
MITDRNRISDPASHGLSQLPEVTMKTAHYFTSGKNKFVIFGENGRFTYMNQKTAVSSKKEAKSLAEKLGATPWNF